MLLKEDPKKNPLALHEHAVRKADRSKYHSKIHQVFNLIYTIQKKVVREFKKCKFCRKLYMINQKKCGNSKLERHKCFLKIQNETASKDDKDKTQSSTSSSSENDSTLTPQSLNSTQVEILVKAFADFSRLSTTLDAESIKGILPKNWASINW